MTTKDSQSDDDSEDPEVEGDTSEDGESRLTKSPEVEPESESSEAEPGSPSQSKVRKAPLSKEALEKLLDCFSPNRDEAAKLYLKKLVKLARYFEWNDCDDPETLAEEALDRVARKIDAGTIIHNLNGYINGVARKVFDEERARRNRFPMVDEDLANTVPSPPPDPDLTDGKTTRRLLCLDICLDELPAKKRTLVDGYFGDGSAIERRRELAKSLGIGANALRIRVCRILKELEQCMDKCCKQHS